MIFLLIVLLQIKLICCKLDITSVECQVYLNKFDDIVFDNSAEYISENQQIIFNFGYFDPLFTDQIFYGLTKEDGKPIDSVCLDLKIFFFSTSSYSDLINVGDTSLSFSNKETTKYRYLSLTISENEISMLVTKINKYLYSFRCFYAMIYYLSDQIYYVHKAQIQLEFLHYIFDHINPFYDLLPPEISIKFCNDSICSSSEIKEIYLHDQFYIQLEIISPLYTQYYFNLTDVTYQGNGLLKQAEAKSIDNSMRGKITILLEASIAWSDLEIQVNSDLVEDLKQSLRILEENETISQFVVRNAIQLNGSFNLPSVAENQSLLSQTYFY